MFYHDAFAARYSKQRHEVTQHSSQPPKITSGTTLKRKSNPQDAGDQTSKKFRLAKRSRNTQPSSNPKMIYVPPTPIIGVKRKNINTDGIPSKIPKYDQGIKRKRSDKTEPDMKLIKKVRRITENDDDDKKIKLRPQKIQKKSTKFPVWR